MPCGRGEGWARAARAIRATKRVSRGYLEFHPESASMNKPEIVSKLRHRGALGEDEKPPEVTTTMSLTAHGAVIGIFTLALIAALSIGRPILVPAVSAFVITLMLGPLAVRAERLGIPNVASAIALWLLVLIVVYGVLALLAAPIVEWIGKAPEIGRNIQQKLEVLNGPLASLQEVRNALLPSGSGAGLGVDLVAFVKPVVEVVAPGIGQMLIFFGSLFFMLLGRVQMRHMMVALVRSRDAKLSVLKILNDAEHDLTSYLSTIALINVCVGIGAGAIAYSTGMPSPIAWAVLGFILNFIPYIGALLMELAMFLVGLVAFATLGHALLPPLLYLAMGILEGHFITPGIMGRQLTLHPLTVFLSLVFWTWLWGPIGAFLAVPLLIIGVVAVEQIFARNEPSLPD
jgi:predicted PurR-regulated permease PerM